MTDLIDQAEQPEFSSRKKGAASKPALNSAAENSDFPERFGLVPDVTSSRVRGRSPSQILWLKLRRNRTAMAGLYTLAVMYAAAILAGFVAPYRYDNVRHDLPFYPPMLTRIHIFDEQGRLSRPFV
jgi:hypothetical protein